MQLAFRSHVAAALLLLPVSAAFVAAPVAAQSRNAYGIYAVEVKGSSLREGETIFLRVTGTAGATDAHITLSGIRVPLAEVSPGAYTGSHLIRPGDRIDPRQPAVARLGWADGARTRNGAFPRELLASSARPSTPVVRPERPERPRNEKPTPPVVVAPKIERFAVAPSNRVTRTSTLRFTVVGQAKADAFLEIPGVVNKLDLKETRPGTYEGSYAVRRNDDLSKFDKAVATLRRGDLRTTAQLELRGVVEETRPTPRPDGATRPGTGTRPDGTTRPGAGTRPDGATRPDGSPRPDGATRPGGSTRPDGATRPDGSTRPDGATRPDGTPRGERPDGERRNRDSVGNRDGRNPQVAP